MNIRPQFPEGQCLLLRCWNRSFAAPLNRRWLARDVMRDNLRCRPKGKGNRWARRVSAMIRQQMADPCVLVWPDYLYPASKAQGA